MSNTIYSDKIKVSCSLVHDENGYYHLVYKIVNTKNGKIYIGKHSTKNPYDNYMGSGKLINQAIQKYGIDNFIKEILYCFTNEKEAFLKEAEIVNQDFIKSENTYNVVLGGYMNNGSWIGEAHPMYGRRGEKNPLFGKHLPQETKDKISKANKGRTFTEEHKQKLSKARTGKHTGENAPMYGRRGENNPNFGKHHTEETKRKISKANKGKRRTEETKHKISETHKGLPGYWKGKHLTKDAKEKLSKANKGKPGYWIGKSRSDETKRKLSKMILKMDEFGNIIMEYCGVRECLKQEHISHATLIKLIESNTTHNGFCFKYKNEK